MHQTSLIKHCSALKHAGQSSNFDLGQGFGGWVELDCIDVQTQRFTVTLFQSKVVFERYALRAFQSQVFHATGIVCQVAIIHCQSARIVVHQIDPLV